MCIYTVLWTSTLAWIKESGAVKRGTIEEKKYETKPATCHVAAVMSVGLNLGVRGRSE